MRPRPSTRLTRTSRNRRAFSRVCGLALLPVFAIPAAGAGPVSLTVSAAISLTESLQTIRTIYHERAPDVSVTLNLGSSGLLEQQIAQGAPVDVFISASPREMDQLERLGLIVQGTRRDLLDNALVLIVPKESKGISRFSDLTDPGVKRIAIADPQSVPAGAYARQTLEYFKLYRLIQPKLIFAGDVRQTLAYVETGNVDAGIVYSTDARLSGGVKVASVAPAASHSPIIYPVAVVKGCRYVPAAKQFVRFLRGQAAEQAFKREGFMLAKR